ncbi:MAG: flagellar assembly protein FliH [Gammaproteobacteria bacterium]|nr:flagellar assembly protein FliH [Gammaproteobacteria bacterium]MCP5202291.1 flagellar assembly protein FliH [Gammaproteobacteria bacterium]
MSQLVNPGPEDEVARFEFPNVEGVLVGDGGGGAGMPTARQIEQMHREAWEEGYASGEAEGYAAGEQRGAAAVRQRVELLDGVLRDLTAPLATLDEAVVDSVAELALLIARHLVRRELKVTPGEVVGVVRETLRHLPVATRGTAIHLNPEDVEIVRGALALGGDDVAYRLEPDPLVTRGGCIVESETSRIDASVEARLAAIASKMFGGERESDRAGGS